MGGARYRALRRVGAKDIHGESVRRTLCCVSGSGALCDRCTRCFAPKERTMKTPDFRGNVGQGSLLYIRARKGLVRVVRAHTEL